MFQIQEASIYLSLLLYVFFIRIQILDGMSWNHDDRTSSITTEEFETRRRGNIELALYHITVLRKFQFKVFKQ